MIHHQDAHVTIHHGDCIEAMRELPESSVDSIVTDPPYGLGFMGKAWDDLPPGLPWAQECLRVLKPGGHLLAFGGTRTWHRLACAVEDAGFEMRDSIAWLYGSGFPKSMDVSKAIDKVRDWTLVERLAGEIKRARGAAGLSLAQIGQATQEATSGQYGAWYHRGGHMFFETGRSLPSRPEWEQLRRVLPIAAAFVEVYEAAEREVVSSKITKRADQGWANEAGSGMFQPGNREVQITAPATPEAQQWAGWGTALKPAFEPVVCARKPLAAKTVAANVLQYGTGAINIDAGRIETDEDRRRNAKGGDNGLTGSDTFKIRDRRVEDQAVTSSRWPANVILDEDQAAALDQQTGTLTSRGRKAGTYAGLGYQGSESADFPAVEGDAGGGSRFFYCAKAPKSERPVVDGVAHPTVKPLSLMRYLVKLVTPPGGTVLEPFAGSGATVEACLLEGFDCIAIEREADYLHLIMSRIGRHYLITAEAAAIVLTEQPDLFGDDAA